MRIQVEVWRENEEPLRALWRADHRSSVREHASYLLNLKIVEELERLKTTLSPDTPRAELA
jgi:hypothetical protein